MKLKGWERGNEGRDPVVPVWMVLGCGLGGNFMGNLDGACGYVTWFLGLWCGAGPFGWCLCFEELIIGFVCSM